MKGYNKPSNGHFALGRVFIDRTMIEEIYDTDKEKAMYVVQDTSGQIEKVGEYTHNDQSYHPFNDKTVREGIMQLPSNMGNKRDPHELLDQIRQEYLWRFLDLHTGYLQLLARYCMATWVYDRYSKLPFFKIIGPPGTGKSKFLQICAAISFRPIDLGVSTTPANVFRSIDTYLGSAFFDEANFEDTSNTSDIAKILIAGYEKKGTVKRCDGPNYTSNYYKVYGPKFLAGHSLYKDPGLNSRIITCRSYRSKRLDLDMNMDHAEEMAGSLRNDLLRFRFDQFHKIEPYQEVKGLEGFDARFREIINPLFLTVGETQVPPDLQSYLEELDHQRKILDQSNIEGLVVGEILNQVMNGNTEIRPVTVADKISQMEGFDISREKVGRMFLNLGLGERKQKTSGMFYKVDLQIAEELAHQYGFEYTPVSLNHPVDNATRQNSDMIQQECLAGTHELERGSVSASIDGKKVLAFDQSVDKQDHKLSRATEVFSPKMAPMKFQ